MTIWWPFSKKVELEFLDDNGVLQNRKVPQDKYDALVAEGLHKGALTAHSACRTRILDLTRGVYEENWIVGEDISEDTYDRLRDKSGHLHVLIYLEHGDPKAMAVNEQMWRETRDAISRA